MRKLLTLLAIVYLAPFAWAGTDASNARGFVPGKVYDFGDFDSVNAFNGNLIVQLPIGPRYPVGPDFDFGLTLTYNSQPWDFTNYSIIWTGAPTWFGLGDSSGPDTVSEGHPADLNNAGLGWRVSMGELLEPATGPNQPHGAPNNILPPTNDELAWVYVGPDGAAHKFSGALYASHNSATNCSQMTLAGYCYSTDGSFLRLSSTANGPQVEFPNGHRQSFEHTGNGIWRPNRIFDRFGNEITVAYGIGTNGAALWTIRDNAVSSDVELQRTAVVTFEPDPEDTNNNDGRDRERIDKIVMEGPNGPVTFDFDYGFEMLAPTCTATSFLTQEWRVSQLTAVTQTLGSGDRWDYHFTYVPDDTNTDVNPAYPCSRLGGRLETLKLPTGGIVEYGYGDYFMGVSYCRPPGGGGGGPGPHAAVNALSSSPGVSLRSYKNAIGDEVPIARWDYSPAAGAYVWDTPNCTGPFDPWLHIVNLQYEMLGNSLVTRTENYYSIWAFDFEPPLEESWRQTEYGQPFTRRKIGPGGYIDPDIPSLVNPFIVNGTEYYLSQIVFRCPIADRDAPAEPPFFGDPVRNASCEPERARYVRYEASFPTCSLEDGSCSNIGYRVAGNAEVYLDDGNTYKATELSDFDRFGHYRSSKLWSNIGAQFDPGLVNVPVETKSGFLPTGSHDGSGGGAGGTNPSSIPWLLGRYDFQEVSEGTKGTARQEWCFEGLSPGSSGPPTGFLLGHRTLGSINRSRATTDLVTKFHNGGRGFPDFEYRLGGDRRHNASTTEAWLCTAGTSAEADYEIEHAYQNGVKTGSWYRRDGSRFLSIEEVEVDRLGNTVVSRDVSGLPTTFEHDDRNRVIEIAEPSGTTTTILYSAPGRSVTLDRSSASTTLAHHEFFFDAHGRLIREERRYPSSAPPGYSLAVRCIEHMPNSKIKRRSEFAAACPNTDSDSNWTRYKFYDPFGEPGEVIAPDGKSTRFSYYGSQSRIIRAGIALGISGETTVHTKEVFDRQGRLSRIVENDSAIPGEPVRQTIYGYDVGGHLTKVAVSCRDGFCPAGFAGDQERRMYYDQRGLLLWHEQPEFGTAHHGRVLFERYDAMGRVGTRRFAQMDASRPQAFDLDFNYDRAGRPTQAIERRSGTLIKEYSYGHSNYSEGGQTDYRRGKLVMTKRWNPVPSLRGGGGGVVITELLGYWDVAGRRTTRETRSSDGAIFRSTLRYNANSDLREVDYPTCVYPASCAAALPERRVKTTFALGQPTRIEEISPSARLFSPAIRYFPNGVWKEAEHGNGTVDIQTLYHDYMALVGKLESTNTSTFFTTGTFQYDGMRNIVAMGGDSFRYDTSSQLVSAQLSGLGTQSFQYDLFGNLKQLGSRTLGVDPVSNRLLPTGPESVLYDQNGNLTEYFGSGRSFDAFNQMNSDSGPGVYRELLYSADDERVVVRDHMAETETWSLRGPDEKVLRQAHTNLSRMGPWFWRQDHIFRAGALFAAVVANDTGQKVQHYHLDHLGSTRRITDGQSGLPIGNEMQHWPYGEVAAGTVDGPEPLRFTGHERDYGCSSGACAGQAGVRDDLDYMHARYYSPWLGRFLSVDPVAGNRQKPSSWNRYAYVQGRPLVGVDPNGAEIRIVSSDPSFRIMVEASLAVLKGKGGRLQALVEGLEKSPHLHTIQEVSGTAASARPLSKIEDAKNGVGTSSLMYLPMLVQGEGGEFITLETALAHELSHTEDYDTGTQDESARCDDCPEREEEKAVRMENLTGEDPKRTTYNGKKVKDPTATPPDPRQKKKPAKV